MQTFGWIGLIFTCLPCTSIVVMCGAIELANFLRMTAAWRTATLQFGRDKLIQIYDDKRGHNRYGDKIFDYGDVE